MTRPLRCVGAGCRQDAVGGTSRCRDHQPKSAWGRYIKAHHERAEVYRSSGWAIARRRQLAEHPFCAVCGVKAGAVDHIRPLAEGGAKLDPGNLQSLCKRCHGQKTQRESHRGRRRPPSGYGTSSVDTEEGASDDEEGAR